MYIRWVYTDVVTTKVFKSGNSQAVRIPKQYQFDSDKVEIFKRGDEIVLRPPRRNLGEAFRLLTTMSDDFMKDGREQPEDQERDLFQ